MLAYQQKKSKKTRRKHVALYGETFCFSGGGTFVLTMITNALTMKSDKIKLFLLLPQDLKLTPIKLLRRLAGKTKRALLKFMGSKIETNHVDGRTIIKILKKIDPSIELFFYNSTEGSLQKTLSKIKADVVMPLMASPKGTITTPWVGGIYDLQYKFYPDFFPGMNFEERDNVMKQMLDSAKVILTNSKNTKNDINKFFASCQSKIISMPIATMPEKNWFPCDFKTVKHKYALPKKYFLISNQLWIHKSHITAFRALKKLISKTSNPPSIVCTGVNHDVRFPKHFEKIKKEIENLGIEKQIHFLGYIPKKDQIAIMQNSIALIQPTLFEGGPGGGSTQNAIAVGTPAIISDIPVNKEVESELVTFFKAGDENDLAEKMLASLNKKPKPKTPEELIKQAEEKYEKLGDTLLEAIEIACEKKS